MEEIIITFIHGKEELDLLLPNDIEAKEAASLLAKHFQHTYKGMEPPEIEYSFDQKQWYKADPEETLEHAMIWDGVFLRLCKNGMSSLPTIYEGKDEQIEELVERSDDYVWKMIQ
ncbi:hypothetical protein [Priestia endophytica]|jgi:hypothetical protein|uniref:hypothetical protein n=1 Tax=Priestia endophytica TaxID=135735 RepID=UPI000F54535F|nr:hypothetical protein [Priestia endophytica]RPK15101.1 hypothetical protein FH5_00536 [Priestia endophytica]